MTHSIVALPSIEMLDGRKIPALGYGVWQIAPESAADSVRTALELGYRSIDTAAVYDNEEGVGEGIRTSGLAREAVFVTTKLWNTAHARDDAVRAIETSLGKLGLEWVDLYLIHWPAPVYGLHCEAWSTLIQLRSQGLTRSIGVSNFAIEHLEDVLSESGEMPVVNQVELHPYFQQRELREYHAAHHIVTEAWSPLGQGGAVLTDPTLVAIATEHDRTVAQVILRWHLQLGTVAIPKSVTPARMAENIDIVDFELTAEQMLRIQQLDRPDGRIGPDPHLATF